MSSMGGYKEIPLKVGRRCDWTIKVDGIEYTCERLINKRSYDPNVEHEVNVNGIQIIWEAEFA